MFYLFAAQLGKLSKQDLKTVDLVLHYPNLREQSLILAQHNINTVVGEKNKKGHISAVCLHPTHVNYRNLTKNKSEHR